MSGKFVHQGTTNVQAPHVTVKVNNPVPPEQLQQVKNIQTQLPILAQQIEHLRAAKIDTTQQQTVYNDLKAKVDAFISVYGNPANFI